MACVAVEEPDLELEPRCELHEQPVGLLEAEAVTEERHRLVERRRREHRVAESDAVGGESVGHEGRRERRRRVRQPEHDLDLHAPRRHRAGQSTHPPPLQVVRVTLDDLRAEPAQTLHGRVERVGVDRLDAEGHRVVRGTGLDDDPLRPVVVAPGQRTVAGLTGDQTHHLGQCRGDGLGFRQLEDEIAELDLVVHAWSSREVSGIGGHRSPTRFGNNARVFRRSISASEPAGSPAASSCPVASSATKSGVNG